jgi:hypothetical protein
MLRECLVPYGTSLAVLTIVFTKEFSIFAEHVSVFSVKDLESTFYVIDGRGRKKSRKTVTNTPRM